MEEEEEVTRSLGDHCNVRCGTGSVEPKQPYDINIKKPIHSLKAVTG